MDSFPNLELDSQWDCPNHTRSGKNTQFFVTSENAALSNGKVTPVFQPFSSPQVSLDPPSQPNCE
jgi:hypothetical protein